MDLDLRDWWVVNESWKLVVMCQLHQSDEIQDWKTKLNIIGTCTLNFNLQTTQVTRNNFRNVQEVHVVLVLQLVGIVILNMLKEMFEAGTGIEPKIPRLFSSQVLVHWAI